jgi:hypothetical protein
MYVNAFVMMFIAWGIGRRQRAYYYLALAVILANILLTITDEFGLFDLIVLLLNLAILFLLLAGRSNYLPPKPADQPPAELLLGQAQSSGQASDDHLPTTGL